MKRLIIIAGLLAQSACASDAFTFVWMSDIHFQTNENAQNVVLSNAIQYASTTFNPSFFVFTGDIANEAMTDEYTWFLNSMADAGKPYYVVPGNHDECEGVESESDPCTQNFSTYTTSLSKGTNFVVTNGGFVLLGFTDNGRRSDPFKGYHEIQDGTSNWLAAALVNATNRNAIVFSHSPVLGSAGEFGSGLVDDYGRAFCTNKMAVHGHVVAELSGHRHLGTPTITSHGTVHVSGPSLRFGVDGSFWPSGAFMLCTVSNSALSVRVVENDSPTYTLTSTNIVIPFTDLSATVRTMNVRGTLGVGEVKIP